MRIKALDHGFVDLVDHMGGDLSVVNAAKVSFGNRSKEVGAKEIKLLNYLADHNHSSPFRHCQFQFHFKMPEFVARQFFKHLIGCAYTSGDQSFTDTGWNEVSGRYVELEEVDFYYPQAWRQQSSNNKQASEGLLEDPVASYKLSSEYEYVIAAAKGLYKDLRAKGIAREQARMILPVSFYTEFFWTASLQAVVHMIKLRTHTGAQQEIQEYAKIVQELVAQIAPHSLEALLK